MSGNHPLEPGKSTNGHPHKEKPLSLLQEQIAHSSSTRGGASAHPTHTCWNVVQVTTPQLLKGHM